ncbi:MAG: ABC transporter permease [Chloroflexi bacterium]|nr:ABC transporter permease [Chloroflexota bacterium]
MGRFVAQRLVGLLLTLWVIVTITFLLMHAIPGDPFRGESRIPESVLKNIRAFYGTDQPLWEQYGRYLWNLVRGDLGPSFKNTGQSVNELIGDGAAVSAILGFQALIIALVFGLLLGIVSALRPGGLADGTAMLFGTVGVSVPGFVLAPILIQVLAVQAGWFPVATWGTWRHTVLPSLALSFLPMAYVARLVRSSLLETLGQDFVRTARAKGLRPWRVMTVHALRNSLIPLTTVLGPLIANIVVGSFVIEEIFGIPGTGKQLVRAIFERNYPVILGSAIYYSVVLLSLNLLVDIAYGVIDPRIRVARSNA